MTMAARTEQRHEISVVGRFRMGSGARDVTIHDLSEHGCKFRDRFSSLRIGAAVTVKLGPVGPIEAYVKWREHEEVGVAFAAPLYPAVMDHIRAHFDLRK